MPNPENQFYYNSMKWLLCIMTSTDCHFRIADGSFSSVSSWLPFTVGLVAGIALISSVMTMFMLYRWVSIIILYPVLYRIYRVHALQVGHGTDFWIICIWFVSLTWLDLWSVSANQRPVSRSHDHSQPIRGQYQAPVRAPLTAVYA